MNPNLLKSAWAVALAVALTLGGTALIKANKVTTTSAEREPMPVAAIAYREQPSYQREARFLGVIRAGSDSAVGFEVAGVLTSLTATEGMRVSPGEVLAQLGTDRREARLDAAIATYDRVVAERARAEARAERISQLVRDGSASDQDYDDARYAAQALTAFFAGLSRRHGGRRALLCVDETLARSVLGGDRFETVTLGEMPALAVDSLQEMLDRPALAKKRSWQAMVAHGFAGSRG